ncbi:hypothetical protein N9U95_00650 [Candidatus Pelagibacter sp.]|nr:hypothetical protein [Candidatus Pelagibacter sp.]
MKFVFFAFKHRYRYKDLNNFLHSRFYGKYFLLNLAGPFRYLIAKILLKLKFGFAISCDARPLIENKKSGINFFIRGTNLNIPTNFRYLDNNFVSIKNPFKEEKNIFQIYPINIKYSKINSQSKIIFIGNANININDQQEIIWGKCKKEVFNDFTILDKKKFWEKYLGNNNIEDIFIYYKQFKILLRLEIVRYLKKKFNEQFILIGDDWKNYSISSLRSNFNPNYIRKLYKGNICLDFGSAEGSSSLYSRSNGIIEAGGLILQSKQIDSRDIWGNLESKITFQNFNDLEIIINKLLNNENLSKDILLNISKNFENSKNLIELNFDRIFKDN